MGVGIQLKQGHCAASGLDYNVKMITIYGEAEGIKFTLSTFRHIGKVHNKFEQVFVVFPIH